MSTMDKTSETLAEMASDNSQPPQDDTGSVPSNGDTSTNQAEVPTITEKALQKRVAIAEKKAAEKALAEYKAAYPGMEEQWESFQAFQQNQEAAMTEEQKTLRDLKAQNQLLEGNYKILEKENNAKDEMIYNLTIKQEFDSAVEANNFHSPEHIFTLLKSEFEVDKATGETYVLDQNNERRTIEENGKSVMMRIHHRLVEFGNENQGYVKASAPGKGSIGKASHDGLEHAFDRNDPASRRKVLSQVNSVL